MREMKKTRNTGDKVTGRYGSDRLPASIRRRDGQIAKGDRKGKKVCEGTDFWIQTSHPIYELAKMAGYVDVLEGLPAQYW